MRVLQFSAKIAASASPSSPLGFLVHCAVVAVCVVVFCFQDGVALAPRRLHPVRTLRHHWLRVEQLQLVVQCFFWIEARRAALAHSSFNSLTH